MATPGRSPEPQISSQVENVVARYQNGYRVARTINGLSPICKLVGFLAGICSIFFGVMGSELLMRPNPSMTSVANYGSQHNAYLISVIFFGAFVAFVGWVSGVLVTGYSQHLKAALDAAVNTSPFLSEAQRAELTNLR